MHSRTAAAPSAGTRPFAFASRGLAGLSLRPPILAKLTFPVMDMFAIAPTAMANGFARVCRYRAARSTMSNPEAHAPSMTMGSSGMPNTSAGIRARSDGAFAVSDASLRDRMTSSMARRAASRASAPNSFTHSSRTSPLISDNDWSPKASSASILPTNSRHRARSDRSMPASPIAWDALSTIIRCVRFNRIRSEEAARSS